MGDNDDWNPPVLCFAKGLVGERPSGDETPVGLLRSFGSGCAAGSMEARNGLVDVGCACKGSAIVDCCEKFGMPFCGMEDRLFCGLNGCGCGV